MALEKGKFQTRAELAGQVDAFRDQSSQEQSVVLESLQTRHQELLARISERIPRLVAMAAGKVIAGLELEPAHIESIVNSILDEAPDGEQLDVEMNPEDLQLLRGIHEATETGVGPDPEASGEDFAQALSGLFGGGAGSDGLAEKYPNVSFSENDTLGRGDCLLNSRFGLVDGRVSTRLEAIEESMGGKS